MKNSNDKRMLIKLQCSCKSVENNELADKTEFRSLVETVSKWKGCR